MQSVMNAIDPGSWQAHGLHATDRLWPETNCYTDLWIEILAARKLDPAAMLGFTLTQDFEGDQFTFFKVPLEDLETLYDIQVTELAIFDTVEQHVHRQISRGRMPLVEVDSYFLPDTIGVSYKTNHQKTTIGINAIDVAACRMDYFHNAGFFSVAGEDYRGLMQLLPELQRGDVLFPYTEFVKFPDERREPDLDKVMQVFARHLKRRPGANPLLAYAKQLDDHLETLRAREVGYFHTYAFNTIRQLGANHELLASHLEWIAGQGAMDPGGAATAARNIAEGAKVMQFQLARALKRGNFDKLHDALKPMINAWDVMTDELAGRAGAMKTAA